MAKMTNVRETLSKKKAAQMRETYSKAAGVQLRDDAFIVWYNVPGRRAVILTDENEIVEARTAKHADWFVAKRVKAKATGK